MFLKEHADIRAKIEAKLFPLMGLKTPGAVANANGSAPEPVKAPGAPGIAPAKAVTLPGAAERRK